MQYKYAKRFIDVLLSVIIFIIISPIFLLIMVCVKFFIGSPIFFSQKRTGKDLKCFFLIKFRTMTNEKDKNGSLLPDYMRQTKFGNFLRSSSLDELPELLSIIKGDMSLIGPRPLPTVYDKYYTEFELIRFDVKSGLIPPDSVDDSAIISWEKQFEYDVDYAKNVNLFNDVKIFFKVFRILLQRNKSDYGSFIRKPLNEERKDKVKNNL
ncbi:sugar transferase [Anaerococcus tetradius]|uniref:Bacterial sugar transferase n=1 Tax=Anaerococcus tetradius TaxID=33036 RepID=A0A133KF27_9FIRM|nr:sugar transferase [Anaerococcus tetradius]KWZ78065.1 bacterial sugar transferase [Anaerococcus tetradius]